MMLSTDLHSGAQKKKITREEWFANNKNIPGLAANWNQEFMDGLFDRIAAEEFKVSRRRRDEESLLFFFLIQFFIVF